ncbi:uncharacterized protein NESG_01651 [Nematocida ausubeli]|uniref:CLASP N-terminal domain-containing protein n=1 Tax=Nematocida ausubeli (strain ATCC PRA-371 / ERTm2) TaxID=1913371 RepID=A0A086J0K4_NEMA1|nr:uncharacterized protein NESG_01651 [Nematocida ausubeli]KFG25672.1 hypothetical protein NESG_01651 [Nematocida ausubeli]
MKTLLSTAEAVKRGTLLQREKETENNWNKIDLVLERICEAKTPEDARILAELMPLICIGIQSNRSKLSGSGCKALSNLFEILGNELKDSLPQILPSLLGALSRTNKVIFMRAISTAATIAKQSSLQTIAKHLRIRINTHSKTVRQGLLEMAIHGVERERIKELVEIMELLVEDVNPEIRARAKEGLSRISEMDRKTIVDLTNKAPEKTLPQRNGTLSEMETTMPASILSTVEGSPKPSVVVLKSSGANVVVRGPIRSFASTIFAPENIKKPLQPGYSLERIGQRLEMHKKEVEEGLKKEWTPKKTPIIKKRQGLSIGTPVCIKKQSQEAISYPDEENADLLNISEEIGNLSITKTEDTDHIVENKGMHDNIFSSREIKGTKEFIESCGIANDSMTDGDYSILAPDVFVKRSTTKKI